MTTTRLVTTAAAVVLAAAAFAAIVYVIPSLLRTQASPEAALSERLQDRIENVVTGHVVPRLRTLANAAASLSTDMASYCTHGGVARWDAAKSRFGDTVAAWAAVAHLRFGPLAEETRGQRISFWPDPRSVVWRQMRRPIATQDKTLLEPGGLAKQSVALQGLSALEGLVQKQITVGDSADAAETYKCALATAIAKNVRDTSATVLTGWTSQDGWAARMTHFGKSNSAYETPAGAATELARSAMLAFQIIRDQEVAVVQGVLARKKKPTRLPYFKSGLSKRYIRSSIEGSCELVSLLDLVPMVADQYDHEWLEKWVPSACHALKNMSGKIELTTSDEQTEDKSNEFNVRQLRFYSNGLRQVIGRYLAPAAGLTIGFNELDGD